MNRILVILAIIAVAFAVYTVVDLTPVSKELEPIGKPSMLNQKSEEKVKKVGEKTAVAPLETSKTAVSASQKIIAATGIVESVSEEISVASHVSGVVSEVFVEAGAVVKKGDLLFVIDKRQALADLEVAKAKVEVAKSKLQRATSRLRFYQNIKNKEAIIKQELEDRRNAVLERLADLDESLAAMTKAEVMLDLHNVVAPIDGKVLKLSVRPGEFALANSEKQYLLLASDAGYNVRAQIDEYNLADLRENPVAEIAVRGSREANLQASLLRIEPYVEAKRNLSSQGKELVDTRVLEVIFKIDETKKQLFIGQQVDVYIKN